MKQFLRNNLIPLTTLAGLFCAFLAYAVTRYDYDFGWHLMAGRYILDHGVPHHEVFTYTASSFAWINHEWLNDVLWAAIYGLGGYWLLAAVICSLWMLALWLAGRKSLWWVLLLAGAALIPYSGVRTAVWPVLFIVAAQRFLAGPRRLMWAIPALMLLWANLHGSFFLGLILLAWPLIRRGREGLLVWLLTLTATFVNPYGWKLYIEVFRTVFDSHLHFVVLEWRPVYYLVSTALYLVVFWSLFWLYEAKKLHNLISWNGLFMAMGLSSSRYITLFVASSMDKLSHYGRSLQEQLAARFGRYGLWVPAGMVLAAIALPYFNLMHFENGIRSRTVDYPEAAIAYLRDHPCGGNVFNNYEQGGYLIWHLGGTVYIDGRMPSWRDERGTLYVDSYVKFMENKADRQRQVEALNIRCAIVEPRYNRKAYDGDGDRASLVSAMKSEGWREVIRDGGGILLTR